MQPRRPTRKTTPRTAAAPLESSRGKRRPPAPQPAAAAPAVAPRVTEATIRRTRETIEESAGFMRHGGLALACINARTSAAGMLGARNWFAVAVEYCQALEGVLTPARYPAKGTEQEEMNRAVLFLRIAARDFAEIAAAARTRFEAIKWPADATPGGAP